MLNCLHLPKSSFPSDNIDPLDIKLEAAELYKQDAAELNFALEEEDNARGSSEQ